MLGRFQKKEVKEENTRYITLLYEVTYSSIWSRNLRMDKGRLKMAGSYENGKTRYKCHSTMSRFNTIIKETERNQLIWYGYVMKRGKDYQKPSGNGNLSRNTENQVQLGKLIFKD